MSEKTTQKVSISWIAIGLDIVLVAPLLALMLGCFGDHQDMPRSISGAFALTLDPSFGKALLWGSILCVVTSIVWIAALRHRRGIWAVAAVFAMLFAFGNHVHFRAFCYDHDMTVSWALCPCYSILIGRTWFCCRDELDRDWAWSGVFTFILWNLTLKNGFCFLPYELPFLAGLVLAMILWRLIKHKLMASVIVVLTILVAFMLLSTAQPCFDRPNLIRCKNSLKQLGLTINSYYSDRPTSAMPILKSFEFSASNDGGLGFDANMTSCYADRFDGSSHFVWNPKLSGGKWADWNNPNSPLIWDPMPHKRNGKVNVVFGDAHVEEMTLDRLKELTK